MCATRLIDATAHASVRIRHQYSALRVHRSIHEIEEVAVIWIVPIATGGAQIADRAPLHRIVWSRIYSGPGRTTIERGRDIEMPGRTLVVCHLIRVIARNSRSEECIRRAIVITSNDLRERRVNDAEKGPDVLIVFPVNSLIMRHRNSRMSVNRLVTEIDCVARLIGSLADVCRPDAN